MSWKPEVQCDTTYRWYDNSLRFATEKEAWDNAQDLSDRWAAVLDYRATETEDPVTYTYAGRQLTPVRKDTTVDKTAKAIIEREEL